MIFSNILNLFKLNFFQTFFCNLITFFIFIMPRILDYKFYAYHSLSSIYITIRIDYIKYFHCFFNSFV